VPQQLDEDEAEPSEVVAVAVRVRLERRDAELVADVGVFLRAFLARFVDYVGAAAICRSSVEGGEEEDEE